MYGIRKLLSSQHLSAYYFIEMVDKEAGLDFSKDNRFFPFYTFLAQ